MGFELPMDAWMRGPLDGFVRDGVQRAKDTGWFREEGLDGLRAAFEDHRLHWSKLWAVVVLGHHVSHLDQSSKPERQTN
jgi:hypothetical protein